MLIVPLAPALCDFPIAPLEVLTRTRPHGQQVLCQSTLHLAQTLGPGTFFSFPERQRQPSFTAPHFPLLRITTFSWGIPWMSSS